MAQQRRMNPYDYINDVADRSLFAGRQAELAQITEEIARLASPSPIAPMVAVIGDRRVGKTSLLHRVHELCEQHRVLPVTMALTGVTAADPWEFWRGALHAVLLVLRQAGLASDEAGVGFRTSVQADDHRGSAAVRLEFDTGYGGHLRVSGVPAPYTDILTHDLRTLAGRATQRGYLGILLMLDEAHQLVGSAHITQQLRQAMREAGRYGIIFAGEPSLGQMFTDLKEPLYAQARVIALKNFATLADVAECALLPLDDESRTLMSPMTIDHLAKLSHGKPNQIRLICNSIYKRYENGHQDDLDISIDVLEDVVESVTAAYAEYDLRRGIDMIRRLDSADLEALHNMTRYPDWSTEDIVNLDEAFRGQTESLISAERRRRTLAKKRDKFVAMGLLADEPDRYVLVGGEFVYLYLRFWYEIKKYGRLSRRLVLGKGPPTSFSERAEKLVRSLAWELGRSPEIQMSNMIGHGAGTGFSLEGVRRRFSVLEELLGGGRPPDHKLDEILGQCFQICELVKTPGPYHLLFVSVRNVENPRELMEIELFFPSGETPMAIPVSALKLIRQQADNAKILIEEFDNLIVRLPDLGEMLDMLGVRTAELLENLDLVHRWRLSAIQRLLHLGSGGASTTISQDDPKDEDGTEEWFEFYKKGDSEKAEECLTRKLMELPRNHDSARLYNNRGYIRCGHTSREAVDAGKEDLQKAFDLHHEHLALTLLNLGIVDIDEGNCEKAIERIEDALFLTLGRETISASYLRLRLPASLLGYRQKWEQHPANVLEAAYINEGFS